MNLAIVTYHYIGDEQKYKAGIYPVSAERFSDQLNKLGDIFNFVSEKDLLSALSGQMALPEKSCLITFDDGLRSQFELAVPILEKKNIPAVFYINTMPLSVGRACTVHKIHFLLTILDPEIIFEKILFHYKEFTKEVLDVEDVFKKTINNNPFDNDKIRKLKYILNSYLESDLSKQIVDAIFKIYVSDENSFCRELYMSKHQLITLKNNNLFTLGLHTAAHVDVATASKDYIEEDLLENYKYFKKELLLNEINGLSYPYGIINKISVEEKVYPIAKSLSIKYAVTMNKGVNQDFNDHFLLKRFDTNDVVGGKNPIVKFN